MSAILCLVIWGLFSYLAYGLVFRFALPGLSGISLPKKLLILAGFLLGGVWLAPNIPLPFPGSPDPMGVYKLLYFASAGVWIGLLLWAASLLLAGFPQKNIEGHRPPRFRWLWYALPMVIIWIVYLLAFWPGMMSADSLDQWQQVLTGHYRDHHPAFHTFTIWLATRIFLSPAMVALAQLLGLAVVCGNILAFFEEHGAPRPVLWLAAVIFAASPVNGTMVVTLWKDIPYGIAILGLTYLLLKIVQSNGGWLEAKRSTLLLGVAVSLAALFRHNGWPVAFGSVLLLAFIFPLRWKSISAALLVGLGLYLGIRGPVYRWVGVETPSEQVVESVVRLYFLSANVTHGSQADNAFNTIRPFSTDWTCDVFVTVNEAWNRESASKVSPAFLQVSNFVRRFPQLAMYFYRCNRSLIWIVSDPAQFIRNTSHVPNYVDPNSFGITPDSQLPVLRDPISRFVMKTALDTRINWFVWRPALYLYGFLLLIAIQAIKHRRWKFLMVTAPILLQSIGSTLILMLPNFRYHYSPYLICLIMWPLLFTRSGSQEDGLLPDGTVGLQASEQEARQAAH